MNRLSPNRSQAWFPGRYLPVRHLNGIEVLPDVGRRAEVQIVKNTIHGTAAQLRSLAMQLLAAAVAVERVERREQVRAA